MVFALEMVCLEDLVPQNHRYRKFMSVWDFKVVDEILATLKAENPHVGFGLPRLFRCLLLQFLEDLSDRDLERFIAENNSARWFCGFSLCESTPDHSVFSKTRQKIGTTVLSKLFQELRDQLKQRGYMNEVFTCVDATHLISKAQLWEERDEALKKKETQLNNQTLPKVAHDPQARIGCKGKKKYWYGYKKHVSVDMRSGLINKVAITPANLSDAQGLKHVCPSQGAIYADKGYCIGPAKEIAKKRGCHLAAIKKNNMKDKNREQDRFYSKMRAPYERVFAGQNKRVRYKGIAKNQFSAFMEAICFNLKRLLVLEELRESMVS